MMTHFGKNKKLIRQLTKRLSNDGFLEKTDMGFTTDFNDMVEKPLFISDFPFEQGYTVYDCFFNLDSNQWSKFDLEQNINRMKVQHVE